MAENLLESIALTAACRQLALRCVDGISADTKRCLAYAHRSMGLATALAPEIGTCRRRGGCALRRHKYCRALEAGRVPTGGFSAAADPADDAPAR